MWRLVVLAALLRARPAAASINCRVACRECRDAREPRELLTVYCAMCDECKDRRREREWLIARKQDLDKEAEQKKPSTAGGNHLRTQFREDCVSMCEENRPRDVCPPCPAAAPALPFYDVNAIPAGCPRPPPCEEPTTPPPPPTCPPIPACVKKRPPEYYPPPPPPLYTPAPNTCSPCVNMCPCPDTNKQGSDSVLIGIPGSLL